MSICPPLLTTAMACSDDRALGGASPSSGSDYGATRRALSLIFRLVLRALLGLGLLLGWRRLLGSLP
jgi:hypothetical protein